MLKVLLSLYVSLSAFSLCAQQTMPDWSGPSELVVEDPNKTVTDLVPSVTDKNKVSISWRVSGDLPKFFAIERSIDGKIFEVIAVLSNLEKQGFFQWMDDAPKRGRNFYRLRYASAEADSLYSRTVAASVSADLPIKFYPNPVDQILIVRSEMPIDVQITDATGKLRITQAKVQGLATINVSSLEKGIYLIRFSNKLTGVMYQEKLLKN